MRTLRTPTRAGLVRALTATLTGIILFSASPRSAEVVELPRHAHAQLPRSELSFAIQEGKTDNRFFRQGKIAAHLLATSGELPRVVVAFPAGNMGTALWFDRPAELSVAGEPWSVEREGGMRGIGTTIIAEAPRLRIERTLLASVRVLRHYGRDGALPPAIQHEITSRDPVVFRRTTLDGGHHLELSIEMRHGSAEVEPDGGVVLTAGDSGEIAFRMTALTDDEPLTPVRVADIVKAEAVHDSRALSALTFLTYEQKLLAGSWQYLTYFGRDTLLSTRLLMPVLQPVAVEAALSSVIERLSPGGEVVHEEDIGEWAVLQNLERSPRPVNVRQPVYDYRMVDDDFLLAPVLAAYALDAPAGAERAPGLFARQTHAGISYGEAVRRNLERVLALAEPFAERPAPENLIRLRDELTIGNWRDSGEGLGHGRVPYDVNVALVPAALRAAERLYASGALGVVDEEAAARAGELADAWAHAEPYFEVRVAADEARRRVATYAREEGLDARDALAALTGPVVFPGVALDAGGAPIPVEHSDVGFVMLFTEPDSEWLASVARRVSTPFPAGLLTPVGVLVANPAFAEDAELRALFTRDHYHGAVVWSWQQAMLLSGVRRQLDRADVSEGARAALVAAERALMNVIDATKATRTSELWSFSVDADGYRVVPFGQRKGHRTEGNAVQLWSTVYLALDRPSGS